MYKLNLKSRFVILLTLLLFQGFLVKAQPTVTITPSVNEGCVPFEVSYISEVENCTGVVSYSWDFGYPGGTSSLANPTTLYNNSGEYTVSLTVICVEGIASNQVTISAHQPPVAFFEQTPLTGCAPLGINLTENSTLGDAPISIYRWYWGDGTSAGNGATPSHAYDFTGIFDVLLEITDDNSCTSTYTIEDLVSVSDTPHVEFIAFPMSYCQPMEVNFQSISQTQLNLGYEAFWSFGDSSPNGSGLTIAHDYTNQGSYDVTLTVIDDYGCTNQLTKENFITINQIVPIYSVTEGDTVCKNTPVHFFNLTSYNCTWDFGDGSEVVSQNAPTHFFNTSGEYNITLTVDPDGECTNDTVFQIYVEEVEANFSYSPTDLFTCEVPFEVTFTNESSDNAVSFNYVFGDGFNSEEENPSHEYTSQGSFVTSLVVTSAYGCTNNFIGPTVIINSPDASFEGDTIEGCSERIVNFTYTGITPVGEITNWSWDFGDTNTSNDAENTTHTYTSPGDYIAILSITDENNCIGYFEVEVHVGEPIPPEFAFEQMNDITGEWEELLDNDTIFCAQDTIRIHNLLWENEDISDMEWLIDSISDENNMEEYFEWTLDQDTGSVDIFIVTNFNGCRDTLKLFNRFYIMGPIIESIQSDFECDNPFDYDFTVDIISGDEFENDYWDWIFDDGSSSITHSTLETISHSFPGVGEYFVKVIAYNDESGCEYVDSIRVDISIADAIFYPNNNNVCVNDQVVFTAETDGVESFHWDFGDGDSLDWSDNAFPNHAYSENGDFTVTLTIEGANGCQQQSTANIHVVGPEIEIFALPSAHGCNELEVDFSSNITHDPDYSIIYQLWSFSNSYTNTQDAFTYTFLPGVYDVALTVSITNGVSTCHNTLSLEDYITVSSLETEVHTFENNNIGCTGEIMQFYAGLEDPNLNYNWDFGDTQTSNEMNPVHIFLTGGTYQVTLVVDDGFGCNANGEVEVEIQEVNANFTIAQTEYGCYPAFLNITNHADPDLYSPSFEWIMQNIDTGSSDTLPLYVPEDYYFNAPGTYLITLNVSTVQGCNATSSQTVTVEGPYLEWEIEPDTVCAGESVNFSVFNLDNVETYTWYILGEPFTNQQDFNYTFEDAPPGGFSEIQLSIESGDCNPIFEIKVYVQDVVADIEVIDTASWLPSSGGCSPFIANLNDASTGADSISWLIENQTFENIDSLIYTFAHTSEQDSTFIITLYAENELGCTDSVNQEIEVYASPQIEITPETTICLGDTIGLYATGGSIYNWTPLEFISDEDTNTPTIYPDSSIVYTVHVINSNDCDAFKSVQILVQQIPNVDIYPDTASIIVGDSVLLEIICDQENMTYIWTPEYEITCADCLYPTVSPKEDTRYFLTAIDSVGCFEHNYYVDIYVTVEFTIDVPSAFTPIGAEENRIVKVKGFGIKNLLEFRIYNRWGEEVFFTDDIEQGWDGYVNGKLQNIDTYVYFVKAEMWDGTIETIKGDILLLR